MIHVIWYLGNCRLGRGNENVLRPINDAQMIIQAQHCLICFFYSVKILCNVVFPVTRLVLCSD